LLRRGGIGDAQLAQVLLEIRALQGERAIALDEEDPQSVRQCILSRQQSVGHPVPHLREIAFRILIAEIDEKPSVGANVDKTLSALPDRNGGDDRIRHEHDVCHTKIINECQQSYVVGSVVWLRPLGRVQRVTPGSGCSTCQPGACLARWWRLHFGPRLHWSVGPSGQGVVWSRSQ